MNTVITGSMKVLVTGAASGIGKAVSEKLAARGYELFLSDVDDEGIHKVAAALREGGCKVGCVADDLTDPAGPGRVVEAAANYLGGIRGVVSNAGFVIPGLLTELSQDQFDAPFHLHVRATWLLGKAAYTYLKEARGSFVATSSVASEHPAPTFGSYAASKAAEVAIVRQMAVEWGADGIRCNCISPSATATPLYLKTVDESELKRRAETLPLGRLGMPEDMANVIAFLLGPESGFITGVNVMVDGGMSANLINLSYSRSRKM
jgi:NAD(P)-dependent dehydrogenase (short-subunit alcohol dehydrogenase family)